MSTKRLRRVLNLHHHEQPLHQNETALHSTGTEDSPIWDLYNKKAEIVDGEMIKDWTDSLTFLLVFAGLFSAVLTAFIIESMKLLQEDTGEAVRDILVLVSQQLSNSSIHPYHSQEFVPPTYAVHVNCLLFMSISLSLVAAVAAVISLQWIGEYDYGLNRCPTSKDRTLLRHFRFQGAEKWKMAQMIALLPVLIYISLMLFFLALIIWTFHIHKTVSYFVIGGFSVGGLFYASTTALAFLHPSSPYKTPILKALIYISEQLAIICSQARAALLLQRRDGKAHIEDRKKRLGQRENISISEDQALENNAIIWLSRSLDTAPHAQDVFITILRHWSSAPLHSLSFKPLQTEIQRIINLLLSSYATRTTLSKKDVDDTVLLAQCTSSIVFRVMKTEGWVDTFWRLSLFLNVIEKNITLFNEEQRLLFSSTSWIWEHDINRLNFDNIMLNWYRMPPTVVWRVLDELIQRHDVEDFSKLLASLERCLRIPFRSLKSSHFLPPFLSRKLLELICVNGSLPGTIDRDLHAVVYLSWGRLTREKKLLYRSLELHEIASLCQSSDRYQASQSVERLYNMLVLGPWRPEASAHPIFELLTAIIQTRHLIRKNDQIRLVQAGLSPVPGELKLSHFDSLMSQLHWYPDHISIRDARDVISQILFEICLPATWAWSYVTPFSLNLTDSALSIVAYKMNDRDWDMEIPAVDSEVWFDPLWTAAAIYWCSQSANPVTMNRLDIRSSNKVVGKGNKSLLRTFALQNNIKIRRAAAESISQLRKFKPQIRLLSEGVLSKLLLDSTVGDSSTKSARVVATIPLKTSQFLIFCKAHLSSQTFVTELLVQVHTHIVTDVQQTTSLQILRFFFENCDTVLNYTRGIHELGEVWRRTNGNPLKSLMRTSRSAIRRLQVFDEIVHARMCFDSLLKSQNKLREQLSKQGLLSGLEEYSQDLGISFNSGFASVEQWESWYENVSELVQLCEQDELLDGICLEGLRFEDE